MDMTIQNHPSRLDNPQSLKFETFSYLPPMSDTQIVAQIEYCFSQDWDCAVEYCELERATDDYWYMWKLPMFGERDAKKIMQALNDCRDADPSCLVRLVAYDRKRQSRGMQFVVYKGGL